MAHLEGAYEQVNHHLASIDRRLDGLDARLNGLDRRIDEGFGRLDRKIDDGLRTLDLKIDNRFMWTAGLVLGGWLTTILTVLLHR